MSFHLSNCRSSHLSRLPTKEFIQPRMNVDNENTEPVTDLGLALGYSNPCIQRQLNNDSGAGANAGPSNAAFLMPQSTADGRSDTDNPMVEEVMIPQVAFHAKDDFAGTNTSTGSPTSDAGSMSGCGPNYEHDTGSVGNVEELNTAEGLSVIHVTQNEDQRKSEGDEICAQINIQMVEIETRENNLSSLPGLGRTADISATKIDEPKPYLVANEPFSGDRIGGDTDFGGGNQILGMNDVLTSDIHPADECKASETPVQILRSPGKRPLEKLEQTAENDLQTLVGENACDAASKIVESEFVHEGKNGSQQGEEVLPRNKTIPIQLSQTNSRIQMHRRKGKEKALSDGDGNGRLSKEEDDSHESVESCSSAGLFSKGKRRWSFEEHLIVGSKRVKKQIQETPSSTSYNIQDSSFMNWISNMMKGIPKAMQEEAPFPALAIAHPDHGHQNPPDQSLLICNKNQDQGFKIGFRSIFQSLYCPKAEGEATTLNSNYQTGEGSKELELANKVYNINATPVSICGDGDNICKQLLLPNEKFDESESGNEAGLATQPKKFPMEYATSQENSKTNSGKKKNSCEKEFGKGKNEISSPTSLGKRKTNSAENIDSDLPSEGKRTNDYGYGNNPLASLWITRFCTKSSGPLVNMDDRGQSIDIGLECSTDCTRILPCPQNHVGFSHNHKSVAVREQSIEDPMLALGKESQKCPADTEAVIGVNRIKGHNDQKTVYNLSPLLHSPKSRSSEAMASIFARRLDALKHILPLDATDSATHATITCLFCGSKGHHLQECSEITENEIKDLRRNVDSYNGAEELPCLCIRCFQHNHWAVACPTVSSRGQCQTKCGASLVGPIKMQHKTGGEENSKLLTDWKRQFQAACDGSDLRRSDHGCHWKLNEATAPENVRSDSNSKKKYITSSSGENYLKEHKIAPVCMQISDVPKGIFDTIKSLRLSRSDILKWMNSHMSLSHLDGFFLRLRLGKWEEGLGGTGYHVACITGKQRENLQQNGNISVCVNLGGSKFLVESQYVSNHDFLEDELMAWWSATSSDRWKIPSEEDLRLKVKKKRMLGLL
ncbi:uncharacterized protein LOC133874350 isoform X4 [Alnus glutinosa]|uniref:uncharacterized protein LOC133874350 isoform X4 n=1 Tax=Alnus glutinosa TaxID=3517 RepID=UPI002D778F14|nr:uncharacterized protein LOC133874350 isoform X4 [Alnus glutinosa]